MAGKGKSAARRAPRVTSADIHGLEPDYAAFPDTAKGRAMARQAARKQRDEKTAKQGGTDEPFVVAETE